MSNITVDFSKSCGKMKIMHAVNGGPVGKGIRAAFSNFQEFMDAEIPYARNHDASFFDGYGGEHTVDVHRIFKNFDADVNDPASYWFEATDKYMANLDTAGVKCFYRLGASIEHGTKYGTYPPKDFQKWAEICEHIIRHYTEGWANGFHYDIKYWEIWNEPDCLNSDGTNPCWQGTKEQFVDLFITTVGHLKSNFPNLKIGGPAFCGCWDDAYNEMIFDALKENGLSIDFFSFHGYRNEPKLYAEDGDHAYAFLEKYGLAGKVELILNEWNYVRSWSGDGFEHSIRSMKGLKGSSFIAGTMCVGQTSALDMMMYYDSRPTRWCGMFHTDFHTPLKGYYPFLMYHDLYKMGEHVYSETDDKELYAVAATGENAQGVMLTYFSDDDEAGAKDIEVTLSGIAAPVTAEYYLQDEANDYSIIRKETITADNFTVNLHLKPFTTYFIKLVK